MFRHIFLIRSPRLCTRSLPLLQAAIDTAHPSYSRIWKAHSTAIDQDPPPQLQRDEIYQLNPNGDVPRTFRNTRLRIPRLPSEHHAHTPPRRAQPTSGLFGISPRALTLDSVTTIDEHVSQEEVNRSIEGLRPQTTLLEDAEYRELQQQLVQSYSLSQLKEYYLQNTATEAPEVSAPDTAEETEDLIVYNWKLRRSSLDKPLDELELSKQSIRTIATRILRQIWEITPKFVFETLGEMEVKIQPWQKQLLFHRTTNAQPNYKVWVDAGALTNLAAIMYRPRSRLMRIVANKVDAVYIVDSIKSKLNEAARRSQRTRFWIRGPLDTHTIHEICDETGVVAQSSTAGDTRIYGTDESTIRDVAQKLASISWARSVPTSTISLVADQSLGRVQAYATAVKAVAAHSFGHLHVSPVANEAPASRLTEPKGDRYTAQIDLSSVSTRLAAMVSAELGSRQIESSKRQRTKDTPSEARHQWSGEVCTLYNEQPAPNEPSSSQSYQLPYVQSLLSYFKIGGRRREATCHFIGKSSRTQQHLLDAKWLVDHAAAIEMNFEGFTETRQKDCIQLAVPAAAVDLVLTRTTSLPVDPSLHPWTQNVSFRNQPSREFGINRVEVRNKAANGTPLDHVSATDARGTRNARGPRTYTHQYMETVQVVSLVPRIGNLSEGVEKHVGELLLSTWPDGVELQFRQPQGGPRKLHVACTSEHKKSSDDAQVAVLKAGLIIAQLLTWAGEGRLKPYEFREM